MSASRPEPGPLVAGGFAGGAAPALVILTMVTAVGAVALLAARGATVLVVTVAFAVAVAGLAFAVLVQPGSECCAGAQAAALVALTGAILAVAADTTRLPGVVLAVLATGWIIRQMSRRA
jgi:hypothetical protein